MPLLACPVDHTGLKMIDDAVFCTAEEIHVYSFEDGILRLVPPAVRPDIDAQSAAFEAACASQGQTSPDEVAFKSLPQSGLSGYPNGYWARYATGTALLWRFLEAIRIREGGLPIGPMGEAAVIGAGTGWLAYGLDVAGYTVVALDARAGRRYGLGVYPIARYFRVQADRITPPLARGAFDLLIYQEGLARSGNAAEQQAALQSASRALRPGGWLAVMNVFAESEEDDLALRTLIEGAGFSPMEAPRRAGWRARLGDVRDRLVGRSAEVPPIVVAQKPK